MEAEYLNKRRPDIWMNEGRIFGRPEAGYSDERRPDIRMKRDQILGQTAAKYLQN